MILSNILCTKSKIRAALTAFLNARESSASFHINDSLKSSMVRLLKGASSARQERAATARETSCDER